MMNQLELFLSNQRSEIPRVQDELEQFARQHQIAARPFHGLQLALEEHLTNILSHAYDDTREHQIKVRVQLNPGELRVEVEDDGRPFNPLEWSAPDLSKPIEERPIGGLGIHMMRKSLDGMEYRRNAGKNLLVMIRRI